VLPDLPDGTPALPAVARGAIARAAARPAQARPGLQLVFPAGSATLSADQRARLVAFAATRGSAEMEAIGGGDAGASLSANALELAQNRARVVAQLLAEAGVPRARIRVLAQAGGRGGAARMVE
jgi:outer membrane protein OmpA-like peptidoglycan-associated protein